ncbi:hypothetical protein GN958_ATG15584, partial [Phytophthora infestans]
EAQYFIRRQARVLAAQILNMLFKGSDATKQQCLSGSTWYSSVNSRCRILDSLKVHKMNTMRHELQKPCYTQVKFILVSLVSQALFSGDSYDGYHSVHPFSSTPDERRALLSRFICEACEAVSAETSKKEFMRVGIIPYEPRDKNNRFRIVAESGADDSHCSVNQ